MSRINTNIPAMQAIHRLNRNNADLSERLQRLSSGLRINSGKDAPAGLIASELLRMEINGIGQAIDNSQRADNVINTAEGALSEVSALLLEIQSLANEAANSGVLSDDEIRANQLQVDAILTSINRIANTTEFNGVKLLNGALDYTTSGITASTIDVTTINAAKIPDNGTMTISVGVVASAKSAEIDYSGTTVGTSAVTIEVAGMYGTERLSFVGGTATSAVAFAVNQLKDSTGVSAVVSTSTLRFNSTEYGSSKFVSVTTLAGTFTNSKAVGVDATVTINNNVAQVDGLVASMRNSDLDISLSLDKDFAQQTTATKTFYITGGGSKFQLGAQVTRQGQVNIGIGSVATTRLGDDIVGYLSSLESGGDNSLISGNAVNAQKILSTAIRQIATLRGRLGAFQKNILQTNISSLSIALENVTASESAIRDADFAVETSAMTRSQILVQATTSVLAQANSSAQNVLLLLRG